MRRFAAVLVLAGVLVGAAACGDDGGGDGEAPDDGPTPARAQLDWVLASGATATDEELTERFAESFLAQVPPDQVRQVLVGMAGATVAEVLSGNRTQVKAVVAAGIGAPLTATIVVEPEEPHRISGLLFEPPDLPATPTSWDEVEDRLDDLAGHVGFLAAELSGDGPLRVVQERAAAEAAPLGSVFKLYVLGAVVEAVRAGTLAWDATVTVEEADRSLGAGSQHEVGTEVTVEEAAQLMISLSDNTMTDVLMRLVGRPAVEAQLAVQGLGEASRARTLPFLTTREAFVVKWGPSVEDYAAAGEAERRVMLEELAGEPLPAPESVDLDEPVEIDRIEWFASPHEVAAAHSWLDDQRGTAAGGPLEAILGSNPGIQVDPATWPRGAFKGGSEPGVLAMSWLLERSDGRQFVLVLQSSDPQRPIDPLEGASIAQGAMELLAEA